MLKVQRRMITAYPVAFGETDVKGRIQNVLNYRKPAFWIICISIIVCIVVAVCFLTNPKEEKHNIEVTTGLYTNHDSNENPMFYTAGLLINDDGTFSFSPSVISSYMGVGTWETDGESIIFNDRGMGDNRKIVFLLDEGNLFYDVEKSDQDSMWGLSDGAKFVYQEETSLMEYLVNSNEVDETNISPDETNTDFNENEVQKPSEYSGIVTELRKEMAGEYWMLSGTGGWQSRIYLYSDGYFVGLYEDYDADSVERCEFSGYFEFPVNLSENIYITHIGELVYEEPGKVSEEDGIRVTTSTPYGFTDASTTYIYAPGTPISSLSNYEYFWLSAEREEFWDKGYDEAKDDELPCFAIRNIDANNLNEVDYIFTKVPEKYQSNLGSKRDGDIIITTTDITDELIFNFSGVYFMADAYDWLDNHSERSSIMNFSVGEYSCCLYQYSFDLFTSPDLEKYPDADPTSEYWVIFYTEGESKPLFIKYFNCDYFTREHAMEKIAPGQAIIMEE